MKNAKNEIGPMHLFGEVSKILLALVVGFLVMNAAERNSPAEVFGYYLVIIVLIYSLVLEKEPKAIIRHAFEGHNLEKNNIAWCLRKNENSRNF